MSAKGLLLAASLKTHFLGTALVGENLEVRSEALEAAGVRALPVEERTAAVSYMEADARVRPKVV
jgi:hypothetical protein